MPYYGKQNKKDNNGQSGDKQFNSRDLEGFPIVIKGDVGENGPKNFVSISRKVVEYTNGHAPTEHLSVSYGYTDKDGKDKIKNTVMPNLERFSDDKKAIIANAVALALKLMSPEEFEKTLPQ